MKRLLNGLPSNSRQYEAIFGWSSSKSLNDVRIVEYVIYTHKALGKGVCMPPGNFHLLSFWCNLGMK